MSDSETPKEREDGESNAGDTRGGVIVSVGGVSRKVDGSCGRMVTDGYEEGEKCLCIRTFFSVFKSRELGRVLEGYENMRMRT